MNSDILKVSIYEVIGTSYIQRHHALKCHFKFFQDLGIHFMNVENLSWQRSKFSTNYSLIKRW